MPEKSQPPIDYIGSGGISKADSFDVAIEAATNNDTLVASAASPPTAAAAAAPSSDNNTSSDATIAATLQAMEQLVDIFGFTPTVASEAVDAVGPDVAAAYNYILDGGYGEDKGGPVIPKTDCPHVDSRVRVTLEDLCIGHHCSHYRDVKEERAGGGGGLKGEVEYEEDEEGTTRKICPSRENWICLQCNVSRCSRYVNGHALSHWEDTKAKEVALLEAKRRRRCHPCSSDETNNDDDGDAAANESAAENDDNCENINEKTAAAGHCVMVSLSDLSVWCYECSSYLKHPKLDPLLKRLEELKFPSSSASSGGEERQQQQQQGMKGIENEDIVNHEEGKGRAGGKKEADTEAAAQEESSDYSSDDSVAAEAAEAEREASLFWKSNPPPPLPTTLAEMANFINSPRCKSIAVLAGAGMSVASGIPDFRSAGFGMYDTLQPELLTATEIEREAIRADPTTVFEKSMFLQNQLPCLELKRPFILGTVNKTWRATLAHRFVELLHKKTGKLTRWYTQNIDGLETQCTDLPQNKVVAVHGSMGQAHCEICDTPHDFQWFCNAVKTQIKDVTGQDPAAPQTSTPIPCRNCGRNTVKPTIVLFRSNLPAEFFERIRDDLPSVDLLIVVGTSLTVAPANSLVYKVPHDALRLVVNNEPVGVRLGIRYGEESTRDFFGRGKCDEVLLELMCQLGWLEDLKGLVEDLPEESARVLRERIMEEEANGFGGGDGSGADEVLSDG
uniref:Deacetylase sirtuin-type domain-containing protein n=1 Tax=Helicotheca tamesis TaxID=374047 RepID=A0A7S2H762_9STRA